MPNPCQSCGACCAAYRVSFYCGESDEFDGGTVPAGLIEPIQSESRAAASRRGRPREALRLAARARLIAGLKVATRVIAVLIVDFEGTEIGHYEMPLNAAQHSPEDLCDLIVLAVHRAADSCDLRYDEISGICVGLAVGFLIIN
jgi:hypothetical protein